MPACLTHYYFAQAVQAELPENLRIESEKAFFWGAQGPDFLFCHRYFPWMQGKSYKEYGSLLHKTPPSETLNAMRAFVKRHESDPVYRAYALGFLCHYALDSTAHPYVNAFAETLLAQRPYETTGTLHGEIEAALDAVILRYETGKLPSEVNLKQMFPKNEGVQRHIAKLYKDVIFAVYHEDVSEQEILRATNDAHFVFACVTDRTTLKKRFFERLERGKPHYISSHIVPMTERDDIDYANIQKELWASDRDEDFFELFELAKEKATELIIHFDDCKFSEVTEEKPFG